ncbi:hypothetical protein HDU76_004736, partial [Blyttiomyces sp. JEL0837]
MAADNNNNKGRHRQPQPFEGRDYIKHEQHMKEVIFYLGCEGYGELLQKKNVDSPKDPSPEPLAVSR